MRIVDRTPDLFDEAPSPSCREPLGPGACLLRGFAVKQARALHAGAVLIAAAAPFRHMHTPGGFRMSVAMTNCGAMGWVSDRRGYRYAPHDPLNDRSWPAMPKLFAELARDAAWAAGYADFTPDACLVNRYEPGARMTLHQDKDEKDFAAPIVSLSLGLPAVFLFGGDLRSDRPQRVTLLHGDAMVWGGAARLRHHGILPLKPGTHALTGACRFNLTFRKAR